MMEGGTNAEVGRLRARVASLEGALRAWMDWWACKHGDSELCVSLTNAALAGPPTPDPRDAAYWQRQFEAERQYAEGREQRIAELEMERAGWLSVLRWIAEHPDGQDEPGAANDRRAAWEMSQLARNALAAAEHAGQGQGSGEGEHIHLWLTYAVGTQPATWHCAGCGATTEALPGDLVDTQGSGEATNDHD